MSILTIATQAAQKVNRGYKNWLVNNPEFQEDCAKFQRMEQTFTTPQARKRFHEMARKQLHDKFVPMYHKANERSH